ncbi:MAG: thioredoxin family protein [Nitrospinota bacterium]
MTHVRLPLSASAPGFDLPGVDGRRHRLEDFQAQPLLLVLFTCNHCPYVQAYEERIVALHREFAPRGVALVCINSNDEKLVPEDSFEHMKVRARERGFEFPYLRDASQGVAEAFGAECTPQAFLFDGGRKLRYVGRIDDNWREPDRVSRRELRDALDALLAGKPVPEPETNAIGCTIKWR